MREQRDDQVRKALDALSRTVQCIVKNSKPPYGSESGPKQRSVIVGEIIIEAGGTIAFDKKSDESKEVGVTSIWKLIAYRYPVAQCGPGFKRVSKLTQLSRCDSVRQHWYSLNRGYYELVTYQEEIWKGAFPLIAVPKTSTSNTNVVITVDPAYQLLSGREALQIAIARNASQGEKGMVANAQKATNLGQPIPEIQGRMIKTLVSLPDKLLIRIASSPQGSLPLENN